METEDRRSPSPNDQANYFSILAQEKIFILAFTISTILMALALTYIFSEKYEASTMIFYQPQEITRLKGVDTQAFGSPMPTAPFKVIGQTLQGIVKSDAILRPVVVRLGLDKEQKSTGDIWYISLYKTVKIWVKDTLKSIWMIMKYGRIIEQDPTVKAIEGLRGNIKIVNKDSYIFQIIVRDKTPERAALIVEALAGSLISWLHEQDRNPGDMKRSQLAKLLNEKEREITDYHKQIESILWTHNIASVPTEIKTSMSRLSELELSKTNLESRIQESEAKLGYIAEKILLKKQASSGGELAQGAERIQPEDFKKLSSEKVALGVELSGLLASYASINTSIETLNKRLRKLPFIKNELDKIRSKLETAKHDYVQLSDTNQEATVRATGELSQAMILHRAIIPEAPVAPIKIYHVGLAFMLSLLFSIGLVYLLSYFNIRVFFHSIGINGRRKIPDSSGPDSSTSSNKKNMQAQNG